jgi:hypothetical protein
MNTVKIIAFFIGFAALIGGMFWLGSLAPVSEPDDKSGKTDTKEKDLSENK